MTLASSRGAFGATAIAAVQVISSFGEEDDDDTMMVLSIRGRERERFSPRRCAYQRATINMRLEKWRFLDDIFQFPIFIPFLRELLCSSVRKRPVKENRAATKRARERGRQRQRREEEETFAFLYRLFFTLSFLPIFIPFPLREHKAALLFGEKETVGKGKPRAAATKRGAKRERKRERERERDEKKK